MSEKQQTRFPRQNEGLENFLIRKAIDDYTNSTQSGRRGNAGSSLIGFPAAGGEDQDDN